MTDRTRVIFGPPGHAYVYFIYGMYECLNFVARAGRSSGLRSDPRAGADGGNRDHAPPTSGAKRLEDLASGPGRLTLAMGITRKQNGADLTRSALQVRGLRDEPAIEVAVTPARRDHALRRLAAAVRDRGEPVREPIKAFRRSETVGDLRHSGTEVPLKLKYAQADHLPRVRHPGRRRFGTPQPRCRTARTWTRHLSCSGTAAAERSTLAAIAASVPRASATRWLKVCWPAGCDVTDIGVVPTPVLYFSAQQLNADGAIMITGSHNPPEYNGFKTVCGTGTLHGESDPGSPPPDRAPGLRAWQRAPSATVDVVTPYVDEIASQFHSGPARKACRRCRQWHCRTRHASHLRKDQRRRHRAVLRDGRQLPQSSSRSHGACQSRLT